MVTATAVVDLVALAGAKVVGHYSNLIVVALCVCACVLSYLKHICLHSVLLLPFCLLCYSHPLWFLAFAKIWHNCNLSPVSKFFSIDFWILASFFSFNSDLLQLCRFKISC